MFIATIAMSLETLKLHSDYFTDYVLTSGKKSKGAIEFKGIMKELT